MIDIETFTEGLTKIGLALRQPYDAASMALYFDIMACQTDAEEWRKFVLWALRSQRWPTFAPKVPDLQDALREFRGQKPALSEATQAYERVLRAGEYHPESGTCWTFRGVKDSCGAAAAEAFLAAGGSAAFATTWDEAKRRERFVNAYVTAVREEPTGGLLPEGSIPKALPVATWEPISRAEAAKLMQRVGEVAAPEKAKPVTVELTEDRLARLREQAKEITT